MSNAIMTRCYEPGCRVRVPKGYCDEHRKQRNDEYNKKRRNKGKVEAYKTADWKYASETFRRQNPLCVICKQSGKVTASECVDHILSVQNGGSFWEQSNWQALCKPCHSKKSCEEQNERRRRQGRGM